MVGVVLFISAIVLGPYGLLMLYRAIVGHAKARWRCYRCRFDLRASRSERVCPECGAVIVSAGSRPPIRVRERVGYVAVAVMLLLPAVALVPMIAEFPIVSKLFPNFAKVRLLANATSTNSTPMVTQVAEDAIESFAGGGASESLLNAAVHATLARLTDDRTDYRALVEPSFMTGSVGDSALDALAAALDDPNLRADRFDTLLRVTLDKFRTLPLECTSPVDDVLCDLLLGGRPERMNRRGGNAAAPPRQVTQTQRDLLIDTFLDIQSDPKRKWNEEWGIVIEHANLAGTISTERINRYIEQCYAPRVIILDSPTLLAGDVVEFLVAPQWRLGTGPPVFVAARPVSEQWHDRVTGSVRFGEVTFPGFGGYVDCRGLLALPDSPGRHTLELDIVVRIGRDIHDAMKARVNPFDHNGNSSVWLALPERTVTRRATVEIDLLPSTAPRISLNASAIDAATLQAALGRPWVYADASSAQPRVEVLLSPRGLPLPFAANVFARQDGRECKLGWALINQVTVRSQSLGGETPGFDLRRPFELVLRSDAGPLERPFWYPVAWDGEVVFRIERSNPAPIPAKFGWR